MSLKATVIYEVRLSISREDMLRYYRGSANTVITRSRCGTILQIAAKHLRPFLDHNGVHGIFRLTLTNDNHLVHIDRIS